MTDGNLMNKYSLKEVGWWFTCFAFHGESFTQSETSPLSVKGCVI
jgi:hypothetical protein